VLHLTVRTVYIRLVCRGAGVLCMLFYCSAGAMVQCRCVVMARYCAGLCPSVCRVSRQCVVLWCHCRPIFNL
jgi:hypothetical protein